MFWPVKIRPFATIAAPTAKPEYGAYARPMASRARSTASSINALTSSGTSGSVTDDLLLRIGRCGSPRDEHRGDPASLDLFRLEPQTLELHLLTRFRDLAEQLEDEPPDRIPLLVRELGIEQLVHVVDRGLPRYAVDPLADLDHVGHFGVVLVRDLPDQLFEKSLERDDAGDRPVLVGDDRLVELLLLHLAEQIRDLLRLWHEPRRPADVRQRHVVLSLVQSLEDVLREDDPDDVVEILVEHRDPGVAVFEHERLYVAEGRYVLDRDHVRSRDHDLADDRVAELEDGVDQLLLPLLDHAFFGCDLGGRAELLLGDVGAFLQPLAGHQHVGEHEERLRERPEDACEEHDRRRDHERHPVGAFDREGLRRHLGEHEQQQGHADRRHDLPCLMEMTHGERRRDRRAPDREQQRQEQHDVEERGGGLHDPNELGGAAAAVLAETERSHAVHPRDGDLGCSEEPDTHDRDDDEGEREPVGGRHGASTPLYAVWRAHIVAFSPSSSWSYPTRCRTPWTTSRRSSPAGSPGLLRAATDGAITTSPSTRRPRSSSPSRGKLSTSVGPGSSRYRTWRSSISASSTKLSESSTSLSPSASKVARASDANASTSTGADWRSLIRTAGAVGEVWPPLGSSLIVAQSSAASRCWP